MPQHVVQRGNDRQPTFYELQDYWIYKSFLKQAAVDHPCQIHAYVLMTNHVHLLVTPTTEDSLSGLMQSLGRRYVRYINDTYRRTGTLWEGRYKACLVQTDRHLTACYRYIELNPVRAGMVTRAADYPHSSHHHNALGNPDPLITAHAIYLALGADTPSRCATYRQEFESETQSTDAKQFRAATESCSIIGDDGFKDQIESLLARRVRPGKSGRPRKIAV